MSLAPSHPHWGLNPKPRHVPLPRNQTVTSSRFMGGCSTTEPGLIFHRMEKLQRSVILHSCISIHIHKTYRSVLHPSHHTQRHPIAEDRQCWELPAVPCPAEGQPEVEAALSTTSQDFFMFDLRKESYHCLSLALLISYSVTYTDMHMSFNSRAMFCTPNSMWKNLLSSFISLGAKS